MVSEKKPGKQTSSSFFPIHNCSSYLWLALSTQTSGGISIPHDPLALSLDASAYKER